MEMKTSSVSRATGEFEIGGLVCGDQTSPRGGSPNGDCQAGGRSGCATAVNRRSRLRRRAPFEGTVDRLHGRAQHLGHFAGVEPQYVAKHQHRQLPRRKEQAAITLIAWAAALGVVGIALTVRQDIS